jgi:hypothetical protein
VFPSEHRFNHNDFTLLPCETLRAIAVRVPAALEALFTSTPCFVQKGQCRWSVVTNGPDLMLRKLS